MIEEWNLRKEKKKEVRKKRKLERAAKAKKQLEWDEFEKRLAKEKEIEKRVRQVEYEETRNRFKERERERQLLDASKRPLKLYQHDNIIRPKDFVVWRSTFKCVHNNHELEDVVASVEVIDNKGNVIPVKIPAGYCGTCNLFIIMDSVYQDLKKRGTPICRVTDEAGCYGGYESANGMLLADESLLM